MVPCEHSDIDTDIKTININGCAEVVSPVLLRIVIVAYVMTTTLVIIQVFLGFLITKVVIRQVSEYQALFLSTDEIIADYKKINMRNVSFLSFSQNLCQ